MHDELKAYKNQDFKLGKWKVHQALLSDIDEQFGNEEMYWSVICGFCATAYDERLYLWSKGIDFNSMTDWQVFVMRVDEGIVLPVDFFFPEIHIECFRSYIDKDTNDIILVDNENHIVLTESEYNQLADFLRFTHGLPKNAIKDGNQATKEWRLQRELEKLERKIASGIKDEFNSIILPCVSTLTNMPGFKYNWHTVWDLPVNVFFDALKRHQIIKQADNLMQGLYSGCIDYKTMKNKDDLNWLKAIKK